MEKIHINDIKSDNIDHAKINISLEGKEEFSSNRDKHIKDLVKITLLKKDGIQNIDFKGIDSYKVDKIIKDVSVIILKEEKEIGYVFDDKIIIGELNNLLYSLKEAEDNFSFSQKRIGGSTFSISNMIRLFDNIVQNRELVIVMNNFKKSINKLKMDKNNFKNK